MDFGFHPLYLVVLLVIALVLFGPGKLPQLGAALGRGMREFREATDRPRPVASTVPDPDAEGAAAEEASFTEPEAARPTASGSTETRT